MNVPPAAQQSVFDALHTLYARADDVVEDMEVGKRHLCVHLIKDMDYMGNPSLYGNWYEESLNKLFKAFLRTVSQATSDPFVLLRMRDGLNAGGLAQTKS